MSAPRQLRSPRAVIEAAVAAHRAGRLTPAVRAHAVTALIDAIQAVRVGTMTPKEGEELARMAGCLSGESVMRRTDAEPGGEA